MGETTLSDQSANDLLAAAFEAEAGGDPKRLRRLVKAHATFLRTIVEKAEADVAHV